VNRAVILALTTVLTVAAPTKCSGTAAPEPRNGNGVVVETLNKTCGTRGALENACAVRCSLGEHCSYSITYLDRRSGARLTVEDASRYEWRGCTSAAKRAVYWPDCGR
jgi:hypothetical protein